MGISNRSKRLAKGREFRRVFNEGRVIVGREIVLYLSGNGLNENRIGFAIGKKLGGAVDRNRLKRVFREAYRMLEGGLERGFDIVVVPRWGAKGKGMREICGLLEGLFREAGMWKGNPNHRRAFVEGEEGY